MATAKFEIDDKKEKYWFKRPENYVFKAKKGLSDKTVAEISWMKEEPEWMLKFRLRALEIFKKKTMPKWGGDLSGIDFNNIFYYIKPSEKKHPFME